VYTIDEPSDDYDRRTMDDVRTRFSIVLPPSLPVHFVHLHELKHFLGEYIIIATSFVRFLTPKEPMRRASPRPPDAPFFFSSHSFLLHPPAGIQTSRNALR
jgi:hypothetical protein